MTATYRLRVVYFLSSRHLKTNPICPVKENHPRLYFPLLRLIMGTLVMG
ncbi:hypothetical protein [Salmonella sp. s54836]